MTKYPSQFQTNTAFNTANNIPGDEIDLGQNAVSFVFIPPL